MTRSILAALAASIMVAVCSGTGCSTTGVGDPCVPEQEYEQSFLGFDLNEVSTESKSFQCQTRLCLVNHFQGRVSCVYGQDPNGAPVMGADNAGCCTDTTTCNARAGCCTPGVQQPVTGPVDANNNIVPGAAQVQPQCAGRTASDAVYCSCRCADINGNTNDGANYCTCPDGFTCTQLVTSIGTGNTGLTGAYCVKNSTIYNTSFQCIDCNPAIKNCGAVTNVTM